MASLFEFAPVGLAFLRRSPFAFVRQVSTSSLAATALLLSCPTASAQVDASRFCRDRTPDGYYDCAWLPARIGTITWTVPGPLQSITDDTEHKAIVQYKGIIAKYYTNRCSPIQEAIGQYSLRWPELPAGPITNWEQAGFWANIRAQAVFTFGIKVGEKCEPREVSTYIYQQRFVGCAQGWYASYDSNQPSNRLCFRQPSGSQCRIGDGITLGDQNEAFPQSDLPSVSDRSIEFRRTYNSIGRYGLGSRDAVFGWEDLGGHWWHNFGGRLEPSNDGSTVTLARGINISYFRVGTTRSDGRIDYVPFNRDQRDRLIVERNADATFRRAVYISPENAVEEYEGIDNAGRLVKVTAPNGYSQTLSYIEFRRAKTDPDQYQFPGKEMKLDRVNDSFGRQISFQYTYGLDPTITEGLIDRVVDVDGVEVKFSYERLADPLIGLNAYVVNLIAVTQRDGTVVRYSYAEPASFPNGGARLTHLTSVQDELSVRSKTFRYNGSGQALSTESAGGVNKYQVSGYTYIDPLGTSHGAAPVISAGLNRIGSRYQPAGAGCGPSNSSIGYDTNANVISRSDFQYRQTCYAYDLTRNLEIKRVEGTSQWSNCTNSLNAPPAGSRVISTQWHPDWRLETRIAEPNKITTITYNGQGATCAPSTVLVDGKPPAVVCSRSEQATTDATGALGFAAGLTGTARTWTYTYTTYGRVLTATDPNGKTTTTTYYPDDDPDMGRRGNVATVTNAANHVTRITAYNLHGQPTQIVDPNGLVTDLTYDLRLRLTSRKVGSELTSFTYDPRGLLTNVALPDGASLTYSYDAAHRLVAIADQQGSRIDYTLDAMGNRITERATDNGGTLVRNIQRTVDALSRVQQAVGTAP